MIIWHDETLLTGWPHFVGSVSVVNWGDKTRFRTSIYIYQKHAINVLMIGHCPSRFCAYATLSGQSSWCDAASGRIAERAGASGSAG